MIKIFKRGLIALAPLAITLAIAVWLFSFLEELFRGPLKKILGEYYFPGLGIICGLIFIFIVGILINTWLIRKFYGWGETLIRRIPLLKSIYGAISDVFSYLQEPEKTEKSGRVVRVEINGVHLLGLVTREDFSDLPNGVGQEDEIAVYLPMSYQVGGYSIIVPRNRLEPIDMSVEEAMRYLLIAGAKKR